MGTPNSLSDNPNSLPAGDGIDEVAFISEHLKEIFADYDEFTKITPRIVDCKDPESPARLQWINAIFDNVKVLDLNLPGEILVSSATGDFDVIIFSGEDAQRIVSVLKYNAPMLADKAKICLCLKSDPRRRVKLLTGGFDDVIEINRSTPIEFMSRIFTIWSRYRSNLHERIKNVELESELNKYAYVQNLKNRQKIILTKLINSPNLSATTYSLINAVSSYQESITIDHLRVIVSTLRKNLRPEFNIVYSDAMYRLQEN